MGMTGTCRQVESEGVVPWLPAAAPIPGPAVEGILLEGQNGTTVIACPLREDPHPDLGGD